MSSTAEPEMQTVALPGAEMAVRRLGRPDAEAPLQLVWAHGWGVDHRLMAPLAESFAGRSVGGVVAVAGGLLAVGAGLLVVAAGLLRSPKGYLVADSRQRVTWLPAVAKGLPAFLLRYRPSPKGCWRSMNGCWVTGGRQTVTNGR